MQTENRLLDDLARMANGALNTLAGLREEVDEVALADEADAELERRIGELSGTPMKPKKAAPRRRTPKSGPVA